MSTARKEPTPIKSLHEARTSAAATRPPVYEVADNDTSRGLTSTLIAERITGWTEDAPMTSDMWRGVESEPFARDAYSEHHAEVTEVGFMLREEDTWQLGYSPMASWVTTGSSRSKARVPRHTCARSSLTRFPATTCRSCNPGCSFWPRVDRLRLLRRRDAALPKRVLPDPAWFAAITAACVAFQATAAQTVADYEKRVAGLPLTERIDNNELGLVF